LDYYYKRLGSIHVFKLLAQNLVRVNTRKWILVENGLTSGFTKQRIDLCLNNLDNYIKFIRGMIRNIGCFILVVLISAGFAEAQTKHTISGSIKSAASGEEIIGASIVIKELKTGTTSNQYGFYSITIPSGEYTLVVSSLGYENKVEVVHLDTDRQLKLELSEKSTIINEVVISTEAANKNITSNEMGIQRLEISRIRTLPVLLGEQDILKTLQLLPGVKSAGEGSSGFYVRGGTTDQNLVLLDEAPVYNASHLLGFFSVFNSDAIKDVSLYKGDVPAQYGGRLSSVLDVKMKDGNNKKLGVSGGIGLIASRLTVEGPIVKDRGSFIVSARRTYADVFLKLSPDSLLNKTGLYFYDVNLKANYRLTDKDRIYISGYLGRDAFNFGEQMGFNWGNKTGTFRWNHIFTNRVFLNTSFIASSFDYFINIGNNDNSIQSNIKNLNLKQDYQFYLNPQNTLKFGFNVIQHNFSPGELSSTGSGQLNSIFLPKKKGIESGAYVQNEQSFGTKLKVNYGVRYSLFTELGATDVYNFDDQGNVISTKTYGNNQLITSYGHIEPRISANFILSPRSSVKAAYSANTQYLHLLSNSTSGSPFDIWIPSSKIIKPQQSKQVSLGYFRNFKENQIEASVEIYVKEMTNLIDYKNGADILLNKYVESQLVFGNGTSYGSEFLVKKNYGKLQGWVGYTLSKTDRVFSGIYDGKSFPARQDRRHDVSVVAMYDRGKRWSYSATWVYYTGDAVTFPNGKYYENNQWVPKYSSRNGYRMPDYHRLDIGATCIRKKTEKFESSWTFSLYNAYGRRNAYTITFRENPDNHDETQAVRTSLFSFIPSVTYNFKF
jgi:hypothetical protein